MGGDLILYIKQRAANMGFNPDDIVIREERVEMKAGDTFRALTNGDYWYLYETSNYDSNWKLDSDTSVVFSDDFIMDGKINSSPVECYGNIYIETEADTYTIDPDTQERVPTSDNSNKFVFFVAQTGRLADEKM